MVRPLERHLVEDVASQMSQAAFRVEDVVVQVWNVVHARLPLPRVIVEVPRRHRLPIPLEIGSLEQVLYRQAQLHLLSPHRYPNE